MKKDCILYGAGAVGLEIVKYLADIEEFLNVVCFADADPSKIGSMCYDKPIISVDDMINKANQENILIIITQVNHRDAEDILKSRGVTNYTIYYTLERDYRKNLLEFRRYEDDASYENRQKYADNQTQNDQAIKICTALEQLHFGINEGMVDLTSAKMNFCCEPIIFRPGVFYNQGDDLSDFIKLRDEIIRESIEAAKNPNYKRTLSAVCERCYKFQKRTYKQEDLIKFISLSIYPSPCQCKCSYCNIYRDPRNYQMDDGIKKGYDKTLGMVEYALENRMVAKDAHFQVACGEITIHPFKKRIFDITQGYASTFYTNCFVFDDELANRLHTDPLSRINLSIDAGTSKTWHLVKGVNNFEKIKKNLLAYSKMCLKPNQITLKYIILPGVNDTKEDYNGVVELLLDLRLSHLAISRDASKKYDTIEHQNNELIQTTVSLITLLKENNLKWSLGFFSLREQKMINSIV